MRPGGLRRRHVVEGIFLGDEQLFYSSARLLYAAFPAPAGVHMLHER